MRFHPLHITLFLCTLTVGLPLDNAPRAPQILPRAKTYAIVNVDGGSSTTAPPPAPPSSQPTTIIDDKTKTETIEPPKPTTNKPSATASSPSITSTSSKVPEPQTVTATAAPSVVTVIITETSSPTAYYDDGQWHTSYAIKTWAALSTQSSLPTDVVSW
ncbi:unnamed protein product [Periconia digitata]|uniref:Uncharacterized protein n=1 Tax=Periconia digitata TaxID=1303443 RepID=A0A9W4UQ44_9PLEO|nr:unnamed protein product [Periconia digitata]